MPDHQSCPVARVGPSSFKSLVSNTSSSYKPAASQLTNMYGESSGEPYVEIVEQPMSRGQRFRYKCEGRSAGSLPGETSTLEKKTFPTIYIHNFTGSAAIAVVSCVTKDSPYRPHPHNLVGQDCKDGVCTLRVKGPGPISFSNIGIQCCKRHDVIESLKTRTKIRVDPFATGVPEDLNNVDLNSVRLCFQVFLPDANKKFTRVVKPVVSHPIVDKKTVHDLVICRLSRQSGYAQGGDEVFLLCEKVTKDDIQVRFYQETEDGICWEAFGEFTAQDIHRQYAIVFKTPPYKDPNIQTTVQVFIQLRRPSDDEVGDPKPFQYIPNDTDPHGISIKRKRFSDSGSSQIPTTVWMDIKGDPETADAASPQDVKMRLKRKAERGLLKKEKSTSFESKEKMESSLPEYSFVNTGGSFSASSLSQPAHQTPSTTLYQMALPTSTNAVASNNGYVSYLSLLGAADGNIQQLTLTPVNATTAQVINGNFAQYLQYVTDENADQMTTGQLVISEFSEVNVSNSGEVISVIGTVGAEECVGDGKPSEQVDQMDQ